MQVRILIRQIQGFTQYLNVLINWQKQSKNIEYYIIYKLIENIAIILRKIILKGAMQI